MLEDISEAVETSAEEGKGKTKRTSISLRRNYAFYLIGLDAVIFLLTRLPNLNGIPIHIDECLFIAWAQGALRGAKWWSLVDGKPPLHPWAMGPFLKVFADPLVGARMLSVFFGAIALIAIILMGREFKGWALGAWAGLLWVLCPYVLVYDKTAFMEGMLLSILIVAVFFAVKAARSGKMFYLLISGVFIGAALWTKGTGQLLFLIVPFAYLAREPAPRSGSDSDSPSESPRARRPLLRWIIYTFISLLIGYGIYYLLHISPLYKNMAKRSTVMSRTLPQILKDPLKGVPANFQSIWHNLWHQVTPILLLICLAGLVVGLLLKWRPTVFLWVWLLITVVAVSESARHPFDRYWNVLLPPLILAGGYAITVLPGLAFKKIAALKESSARKYLAGGITVLMALLLVIAIYLPVQEDVRFVANPAKGKTPGSWGWGFKEVVALLKQKSKDQHVDVQAYDWFSGEVLRVYFTDNPNVTCRFVRLPPKVPSTGRPLYLLGTTFRKVPTNWPLTDVRVYSRDGNRNIVTVFARVANPTQGKTSGAPGTTPAP